MRGPAETLLGVLTGQAERSALVTPEDGSRLSYAELAHGVERLAGSLRAAGVERGERVALALPAGPEAVGLLLAITALGGTAAPLNPGYTASEFAFYLDDIRPCLLLLPSGELEAARQAAEGRAALVEVSLGTGWPPELAGERQTAAAGASLDPSPEEVALLLHTSGTTGPPKQVPLRHRNLMASASSIARHYRLSPEDTSYCAMPLFHVHGLVASTLAQLLAGGTVVVPRRLAPGRFWRQLAPHGVSWYSAGPTLHQMLLDRAPAALPAASRLRFVRSSSSALNVRLLERVEELVGAPMLEAYGMTEASHEMAANPLPPAERRPGTVGLPTGAEVRIVDRDGESVPEDELGEVVIRGPGVMSGYLGGEETNAGAFFGEWFRTGDLGAFEDGYLRLGGRIKEIIIRGGENVSPLEVEGVLASHSAVGEAVAYGIPDAKYGQLVGAAVVLHGEADREALLAHCRERLAAFKVPSRLHIVDAIPRTPTGKVQRPRLAAHFGEG